MQSKFVELYIRAAATAEYQFGNAAALETELGNSYTQITKISNDWKFETEKGAVSEQADGTERVGSETIKVDFGTFNIDSHLSTLQGLNGEDVDICIHDPNSSSGTDVESFFFFDTKLILEVLEESEKSARIRMKAEAKTRKAENIFKRYEYDGT